jgi:integrase/recombinase XerD
VNDPLVPTSTAELVESFLDAKVAKGLSPKTIHTSRERLAMFVGWLDDRAITRDNLRFYLAHLQRNPRLSKATVAAYFRDVAVFCGWLVDERILDANPAYKLGPKTPKRRPPHYTEYHIRQLLAVCDARDRAIVIVLLDTGLRASELTSLNRTAIDWETGAFTVVGKGDKERAGWLSPYAQNVLVEYLDRRHDRNPAVFVGTKGRLTPIGVHKMLHRRAQEVGIRDDVRRLIHSFRVTFAKSFIQEGGDLESLRELLGHADISMSAYYAQLADSELAEVKHRVNPLGRMIAGARMPDSE